MKREDRESPEGDHRHIRREGISGSVEVDVQEYNVEADVLMFSQKFQELLADYDQDFLTTVRAACCWALRIYRPPKGYSLDDLVHDVLIKFGLGLDKLRDDKKLRPMLKAVARNQLIDEIRRQKAQRRPQVTDDPDPRPLEERVEARHATAESIHERILLDECRRYLNDEEVELFNLYFVEGETLQDIAALYGISRQAMSKRVKRILKKLEPLVA